MRRGRHKEGQGGVVQAREHDQQGQAGPVAESLCLTCAPSLSSASETEARQPATPVAWRAAPGRRRAWGDMKRLWQPTHRWECRSASVGGHRGMACVGRGLRARDAVPCHALPWQGQACVEKGAAPKPSLHSAPLQVGHK